MYYIKGNKNVRLNLLAPSLEILFVNFHNGCCWSLSFCHYWSSVRRCCRRRKSRIFYHLVIFLCHHHFTLYAPGICFAETASNPCLPPSTSHSFPNFKTYSFDKEERAKLRDATLFSWCEAQCLKITEKVSFFICWAKRAMFIFWVDKNWLKMPKTVYCGEILKTSVKQCYQKGYFLVFKQFRTQGSQNALLFLYMKNVLPRAWANGPEPVHFLIA